MSKLCNYLDRCVGLLQGTGQPLAARASSCPPEASTASKPLRLLETVPFQRNGRRYTPLERTPQGYGSPTAANVQRMQKWEQHYI